MSRKLEVVGLTQSRLAYTNAVFVNPGETTLLPREINYIQLNGGMVYVVKSNEAIGMGELALNKYQRQCCDLSPGMSASIQTWVPAPTAKLLEVKLECDLVQDKRKTIREADLRPAIKEIYCNQAMTKGQIFIAEHKGTVITLTVAACTVPADQSEDGSFARQSKIGIVVKETSIVVSGADNRFLTFEETKRANNMLTKSFDFSQMGIGGLDTEFSAIFRRSFASRLFPPDVIEHLGIKHVKGMLLFGPPGTGKTLIARQIGKMLATKEPKIVNGPEILNKYVGASEENIRKLFEDAEKEYEQKGENSELHIIIFDEIDAICKQRGSARGGTGVQDTVVNQMLTKIDGVNSPNNILIIGMTNRKDMIDTALLRPGRLEVHIEIGLPDAKGRQQILNIHTAKMATAGYLDPSVDLVKLAELTKNYSGAEIEGLVKSAASYSLYGTFDVTKDPTALSKLSANASQISVTMDDFLNAMNEMTPSFGISEDELSSLGRGELLNWGDPYVRLLQTCRTLVQQVQNSDQTPLLSVLLEGPVGSGKTSIMGKLAKECEMPYVKLISPEQLLGYGEAERCGRIQKIFEDAYKTPIALILLDDIERLLDYVPIGPRFANSVLQTLLVLLKKLPPHEDRKLLVIGTTSDIRFLEDVQAKSAFNVVLHTPQLAKSEEIKRVMTDMNLGLSDGELDEIASHCTLPIPIKQLLMVIEMAKQGVPKITPQRFMDCIKDCGLDGQTNNNSNMWDQ